MLCRTFRPGVMVMAWMVRAAAFAVALLLSACVVPPPAGPSVGALPPKDKDAAQFQQEDLSCRQYAAQMLGADAAQYSAAAQQQQYDQSYVQCMSAHGNIAPVATAGAPAYAYPYYPYPYAYAYPYAYGYPWYWGAPVGFGTSFVFVGHGHRHGGHFHGGHGSGPRH
jgi:hypothetical protein